MLSYCFILMQSSSCPLCRDVGDKNARDQKNPFHHCSDVKAITTGGQQEKNKKRERLLAAAKFISNGHFQY